MGHIHFLRHVWYSKIVIDLLNGGQVYVPGFMSSLGSSVRVQVVDIKHAKVSVVVEVGPGKLRAAGDP